jgi:DHA1 family bicyclomycin/chloramphenicol resistance-like MFS transporter
MPQTQPGRFEFVALMAMMSATVALSIDGMLPALPEIGTTLSPEDINRAQLVITSFMLGMGVGTFFTGPLSDAFGRKRVLLSGSAVFILASIVCYQAGTLDTMLAARFVQGLGAAGPRVVALAIIRDLYAGREMARIISFVMIVFTLVPAIAPTVGYLAVVSGDWRLIYLFFAVFALAGGLWLYLRLPEPLAPENRRKLGRREMIEGVREIFSYKVVRYTIAVQSLVFATLIGLLSTIQQIYDISYGRGESFHLWFGLVAVLGASAGFLNSALVRRLGMRYLVSATLAAQIAISGAMIVAFSLDLPPQLSFGLFVFWQFTLFFQAGMCLGNLNALAMEPLGHIAGLGASVISATFTVVAALIAVPIGLSFNGTAVPLAVAVCVGSILALIIMTRLKDVPLDAR